MSPWWNPSLCLATFEWRQSIITLPDQRPASLSLYELHLCGTSWNMYSELCIPVHLMCHGGQLILDLHRHPIKTGSKNLFNLFTINTVWMEHKSTLNTILSQLPKILGTVAHRPNWHMRTLRRCTSKKWTSLSPWKRPLTLKDKRKHLHLPTKNVWID